MAAMNSLKNSNDNLLKSLQALLPEVAFEEASSFYWSPKTQTVTFSRSALAEPQGVWSLIHEAAHAQLGHTTYKTDFELLLLEVAAWKHAVGVAEGLGVYIDEEHIQDCLDTYRDWLHRRSTCPTCSNVGLQHSESQYRCHNCNSEWQVTAARFCRPYRRKNESATKQKSPDSSQSQTTFQ